MLLIMKSRNSAGIPSSVIAPELPDGAESADSAPMRQRSAGSPEKSGRLAHCLGSRRGHDELHVRSLSPPAPPRAASPMALPPVPGVEEVGEAVVSEARELDQAGQGEQTPEPFLRSEERR